MVAGLGVLTLASFDVAAGGSTVDLGSLPPVSDPSAGTQPESLGRARVVAVPAFRRRPTDRTVPPIAIRSGRIEALRQPIVGPIPIRLVIPRIDVDARIHRAGVDRHSFDIAIPDDVRAVGWYRFGPVPGAAGSAVIVGHVDARTQGPGAFFRLSSLRPGNAIVVWLSDGARRSFSVDALRQYRKAALPPIIFRRRGPPQLALITCGGPFDQASRHYRDNVVVYATPNRPASERN